MRIIPASLTAIAFVALSMVGLSAHAATGPVPAASLPGGAVVVDSDNPGAGEAWGRATGRTFSYSGFVLSNFTELRWQALSVGMSFDGAIDAPGENMMLLSQDATTAIWTGTTTVDDQVLGSMVLNTRFTATLTGATFTGDFPPTVDVLANNSFTVHVLFEAEDPNNGGAFGPALDVYDALDTPASPPDLANTTFDQGFFFEEVASGLSLTEHDANMQGRADQIAALLDFLTIETINRLAAINAAAGEHNENTSNQLNAIALTTAENQQKLMELLAQGGNDDLLLAIQNLAGENGQKLMTLLAIVQDLAVNVQNLPDNQQFASLANDQQTVISIIACLWIDALCDQVDGLPPGLPNIVGLDIQLEEIIAGIDWVKQDLAMVKEDLQGIVDKLESGDAGPATIDLDVVSSKDDRGDTRVLLVLSKVDGAATTASLSVQAAPEAGKAGFSLVPVASTTLELAPGVQQLTIELPGDLKKTRTFLISAEQVLEDGSTRHGATLTGKSDTAD